MAYEEIGGRLLLGLGGGGGVYIWAAYLSYIDPLHQDEFFK